jgi:molybdate transport system substrate-binding protein
VWTPSGIAAPAKLEDLTHERFKRIAIANPDHAPYGAAAKQALESWGVVAARGAVVLGDNVQSTMLYARDATRAAVVALSLRWSPTRAFLRIDPAMHAPLDQQLVVCGTGAEADAARQLADFISSREARGDTRYGFVLPEAQPRP